MLVLSAVLMNVLALVGFVIRDRSVLLALLMYLPLLPIGVIALLVGVARRRSLSRPILMIMLALGLSSSATGSYWMIGRGSTPASVPAKRHLKLLHWNVWWGGVPFQSRTPWKELGREIIDKDSDVIVLSEAPLVLPLYQMLDQQPGRRFGLSLLSYGEGRHFYHIFVSARWPLRQERSVPISGGGAAVVRVEHPVQPIRVLLVDGDSTITRLRTPMLEDVARVCEGASEEGKPIDLIVGDFNAVSRSIGFEQVIRAARGYHLASWSSRGWRGTWPSMMPLLDIDHVWVRTGWTILGCQLFSDFASDHRGQVVELGIPEASRHIVPAIQPGGPV
jgi:endonuclease/exonuclease/phosphatase (EEP) superfamily protein YafD